ncbi:hypothetical protein ACIPYR_35715 [Streptomyces parvus]|uniref:hypothetical protein n=1 Tax=Streptomyces parvus TaxID=66428 RepID=UPI003820EBE7
MSTSTHDRAYPNPPPTPTGPPADPHRAPSRPHSSSATATPSSSPSTSPAPAAHERTPRRQPDERTTVRFDLIHSPDHLDPTGPDAPEQLLSCTTDHPAAAELVLHPAQLGDLLRVTGTLTEPDAPSTPPHLRVHTVDILDVAPLTTVSGTVLERYGNYVLVFDADRNEVPVFTTADRWVGEAATPEGIGHLIRAFENTNHP